MPQANLQAFFKSEKIAVEEPQPKQVGKPKGKAKNKKVDERGTLEKGEELEVLQENNASVEAPIAQTIQGNFGG